MSSVLAVLALLVPLALIAFAASPQEKEAPGAPPGPGPEHAKLDAWVGVWDAEVEIFGTTARGTETCRRGLGGFWLVTEFEGSLMGAPYLGHGLTGIEPDGTAVAIWADSTGGPVSVSRGKLAADGKSLATEAEGVDPAGQRARFRHVTTFEGRDKRVFEIRRADAGAGSFEMRITYTRKR